MWRTQTHTFIVDELQSVLRMDASRFSRPVFPDKTLDRTAQISELFDKISYGKGADLCRMLSLLLTEEGFLRGVQVRGLVLLLLLLLLLLLPYAAQLHRASHLLVQLYLKRHEWRTANHTDLWGVLTEVRARVES